MEEMVVGTRRARLELQLGLCDLDPLELLTINAILLKLKSFNIFDID